ncbi:hypothetical protein SAY86_014621 [Trapa natans]|uniref:Uncharacterized protein n=1 Tax=Trapa natans TaxID=22666 RepID=A0AAN7KNX6_TRANT|nr:hypothetical protein SAY86_014621 [Trapa natans]
MLQLFFALAFSAVPLTLYLPPIRSLNLFVETTEEFLRHIALYALSAYPRIRLACSRIFNSVTRFARILRSVLQTQRLAGFSQRLAELDFCPTLIKPILSPRPVNEEDLRPPCTLHGWTCMCMGFLFLSLHSRIRLPCEEISRERELAKMDNAGRWPVFSPPLLPGSAHFA